MMRFIPCLLAAAIAARVTPAAAQAPQASYTPADVRFMSGMIYHHAQAVLIAGWAPSHDAGPAVRTLCDRIVASQKDEIALLSRWLADRHEAVPHPDPQHMMMPDIDSPHMLPGMLLAQPVGEGGGACGPGFGLLFPGLMIQHLQGAITMVNQLFAA